MTSWCEIVKCAKDGDVFQTWTDRKLDSPSRINDGEKEVESQASWAENSKITDNVQSMTVFESACFNGTNIRLY